MIKHPFSTAVGVLLIALIFILSGCQQYIPHSWSDLQDYSVFPEELSGKSYQVSSEALQEAVLYALKKTNFQIHEEKQITETTWRVIAELGWSMQSNGQFVRITVKAGDKPNTSILLYDAIKRMEANITENLWAVRTNVMTRIDDHIDFQ